MRRLRSLLAIGCLLALEACTVSRAKTNPPKASAPQPPPPAAQPSSSPPAIQVPALPAPIEPLNDAERKLDGTLIQVVRAAESGGAEQAMAAAKSLSILAEDKHIKIDVALVDKSNIPTFKEAIGGLGGQVIVSLENHVFVLIPPTAIEFVAFRADVFAITAVVVNVHP